MVEATKEAGKSKAEDDGPRPFVGAILVGPDGVELGRAHRGEIAGLHAEQILLTKKFPLPVPPGSTLYTTLEPCIHRGVHTEPCAELIVSRGIHKVAIGTLDPNPAIVGKGESFLGFNDVEVDHFPPHIAGDLRALNARFFEHYRSEYGARSSIYATGGEPSRTLIMNSRKSSDRNRLLSASLDLITGTSGDILSVGAGLSWVRDAFVSLLEARLDGRSIRVVSHLPDASQESFVHEAARLGLRAIGASHRVAEQRPAVLGTWTGDSDEATVIAIDTTMAHLFRRSEEPGLVGVVTSYAEELFDESRPLYTESPRDLTFQALDPDVVFNILRSSVPSYRDSEMTLASLNPRSIAPLTNRLEFFKLFRSRKLQTLQVQGRVPGIFYVTGAPQWIFIPPIVEMHGSQMAVVDGTHRVYDAVTAGRPEIDCIVVSPVDDPLPAVPVNGWDEVRPARTKLQRKDRYQGYREDLFRPIRAALSSANAEGLLPGEVRG